MENTRKAALDMFFIQLIWAFWFLGIMLIINVVRIIVFGREVNTFYDSVYVAGNIFMLVIGLISTAFLPYFVELGVTRKAYFKGVLFAALGLSIALPILSLVISYLEKIVLSLFMNPSFVNASYNDIDFDGNVIGDLIEVIVAAPHVSIEDQFFLSLALFSFHLFSYYLAGWFISCCYYRFGQIAFVSIAIAVSMYLLIDTSIRTLLDLPSIPWYSGVADLPAGVLISLIALVIVIWIAAVKFLTKNVAIKI